MAHAVKGLFSKFNKNILKSGKDKKGQSEVHTGNERQEELIQLYRATLIHGSPFIQDAWYSGFVVGVDLESRSSPLARLPTALDGLDSRDIRNIHVDERLLFRSHSLTSPGDGSDVKGNGCLVEAQGKHHVHNLHQENLFPDVSSDKMQVEPGLSSNVSDVPRSTSEEHPGIQRHQIQSHVSSVPGSCVEQHHERSSTDRNTGNVSAEPGSSEDQHLEVTHRVLSNVSDASYSSKEDPEQEVTLRRRVSRNVSESGKDKDQEVKLKDRVSSLFQGVRKSTLSWTSRDSGVASSIADSVDLDWIGDDDSDWDDDDFSDDSDFDDDFYEDFRNRISELDVADTQTPALADTQTADRQRAETACRIAVFILQTEMQYVQQLTNLVKILSGLASVAKKHKGSDPERYLKEMAKTAASILQFHTNFFLPAMKTRLAEWKSRPLLGDVMKTNAPFFKLYRSYTLPFEHAVVVVGGWRREPRRFASLIRDIKKLPECDNVPFQDFMWYPLQRLHTMELFLSAYLKNLSDDAKEAEDIKEALELLGDAKEYPQKATRKRTMHKVKHDIRQPTKTSTTPQPSISEEQEEQEEPVEEPVEEPPSPEVHPEDDIVPTDKVHRIVLELLTTERSYVRKLRLLQTIEDRFRRENTLPDDVIKDIFSKILSILTFHSSYLLPQLEERVINWEANKRIGDVLKTSAPFLKIYAEYIQNYANAKHQIEAWKKKSAKFSAVLQEIRSSAESGGIPLDGHLLEPVQRIPRYELLLREYLKNIPDASEDKENGEEALKLVMEAASHSNQFLKQMDKFKKTYDVYQTLKGTKVDFNVAQRELLKEGAVTFITPGTCEKQRKVLFLFSDVIILCSEALFGKFTVTYELPLSGLKITKEETVVPDTFVVMGTNSAVELQNVEGDIDWYQEIANVLQEKRTSNIGDSECAGSTQGDDDSTLTASTEISRDEIGKRAPRLKPFQTAAKCQRCRTRFGGTMKKYNCKGCGFVICGKCSRHTKLEYRSMKPGRVCYECYMLLHTDSSSENSDVNEDDV